MGGLIIREVGEILKQTLMARITELPDDSYYTFDSPAEIDMGTRLILSIFLYQIQGNDYLKNGYREPTGVSNQYRDPPVVLDLYYLFTPFADNRETEWMILESIAQIFGHKGVIAAGGSTVLVASGNEEIRIAPGGLSFQEATEMWSSFPSQPLKLSMSYLVSPVRIPVEETVVIPRVEQVSVGVHKKT